MRIDKPYIRSTLAEVQTTSPRWTGKDLKISNNNIAKLLATPDGLDNYLREIFIRSSDIGLVFRHFVNSLNDHFALERDGKHQQASDHLYFYLLHTVNHMVYDSRVSGWNTASNRVNTFCDIAAISPARREKFKREISYMFAKSCKFLFQNDFTVERLTSQSKTIFTSKNGETRPSSRLDLDVEDRHRTFREMMITYMLAQHISVLIDNPRLGSYVGNLLSGRLEELNKTLSIPTPYSLRLDYYVVKFFQGIMPGEGFESEQRNNLSDALLKILAYADEGNIQSYQATLEHISNHPVLSELRSAELDNALDLFFKLTSDNIHTVLQPYSNIEPVIFFDNSFFKHSLLDKLLRLKSSIRN